MMLRGTATSRRLAVLALLFLGAGVLVRAQDAGLVANRVTKRSARKGKSSVAKKVPLAPRAPATLEESITEALATRGLRRARIGIHILEIESGTELYSREPDTLFSVASNNKLFTTAAALARLGPMYQFKTEVFVRGNVDAAGWLEGDIKVVGSGDPGISGRFFDGDTTAVFQDWAKALEQAGIRELRGDIYLDAGFFDLEFVHPEWPRDQLMRWYEAPIAALAVNESMITVRVRPTRAGSRAVVETDPPTSNLLIDNRVITTLQSRGSGISIQRDPDSSVIEVSGRIYERGGTREGLITVVDPVAYFGQVLIATLRAAGIGVSGRVISASNEKSPGWKSLALHRSSLPEVIEVVNKRSQNFFAEAVLKTLGAEMERSGSFAAGVVAVTKFLAGIGVPPGMVVMRDGSGMARGNRATPRAFTTLLRHMFRGRYQREFVSSLPYSGEPGGRLRHRLNRPPYLRNVYAKTGTIEGVTTLSGYVKARSGSVYAFSMLFNGVPGAWPGVMAQDAILRALIDKG